MSQAHQLHRVQPPVGSLKPELESFLRERLASMEQVQIVLLLRSDVSHAWTAPEVATRLGTPPESTAMRLFLLASNGILAFEGPGVPRYRYACADAGTAQLIDEIATIYDENRRLIADTIEAPPPDPVRSFADAFKLKK